MTFHNHSKYKHIYVIVRMDFYLRDVAKEEESIITTPKAFWTLEEAKQEVGRLNKLNNKKEMKYFWQMSRLVDRENSRNT